MKSSTEASEHRSPPAWALVKSSSIIPANSLTQSLASVRQIVTVSCSKPAFQTHAVEKLGSGHC